MKDVVYFIGLVNFFNVGNFLGLFFGQFVIFLDCGVFIGMVDESYFLKVFFDVIGEEGNYGIFLVQFVEVEQAIVLLKGEKGIFVFGYQVI